MRTKRIFFILFLVLSFQSGFSQILDDSTKLIYGPHSTKYVKEEDLIDNTNKSYKIDTSITGFHNYDLLYNGKLVYQNLGNFGTPLGNIYFTPAQSIGKNFGFTAFSPYAFDPGSIRYYDTKSPFTSVTYIQGANGQQLGDAEFSRNIKPNWNAGFEVKKFTSQKVIGFPLTKEKQSDHTSFLFYTRFFTKDSSYQVMFNYTFLDHKNYETGGVVPDSSANSVYFGYKKQNSYLHYARSFEKRSNFHLYHQYAPFKNSLVQLFHIMDYYVQSNRFNDSKSSLDTTYYPFLPGLFLPTYFNSAGTSDRTDFKLFENKVGIKGNIKGGYYRIYYRRKDFTYTLYEPSFTRTFTENFAGAVLAYSITSNSKLNLSGEYLINRDLVAQTALPSNFKNDYKIRAEYSSQLFTAGYYRILSSPTLLQSIFVGNNFMWYNENNFVNPLSDNFYLNSTIELKDLSLNPGVNFSNIKNYIYFDTLATPSQYAGNINYFSADLLLKYHYKKIYMEDLIRYANASHIIQVPSLYNHARIYYQNKLFKKVLLLQIGFDVFYKNSYYANYYMPVTQQYYLNQGQYAFRMPSYWVADFFVNLKIKAANGFIKISNFNQRLLTPGYLITPYYPGMYFNFEFGVRWLFFD